MGDVKMTRASKHELLQYDTVGNEWLIWRGLFAMSAASRFWGVAKW